MPKGPEEDLSQFVLQLALLTGWRRAHFRPAKTERGWRTAVEGDGKGFPDLTLIRGRRLVFAELKSDRGKTSPDQDLWLEALRGIPGIEVYVWRPRDLAEIQRVLAK